MADGNLGIRARDRLANERTFFAWVQTALGGLQGSSTVAILVEGLVITALAVVVVF